MGWFDPSYDDPINQDVAAQIKSPIERYVDNTNSIRQMRNSNNLTLTIQHRLCHLIYRMDMKPSTKRAIAAKWYLLNLTSRLPTFRLPFNITNELTDRQIASFANLRQRLQDLVDQFEQRYGVIDATYFDKLLAYAKTSPDIILCGMPLYSIIESSYGTPDGELSHFVSDYMWRQSMVVNNRV